MDDHLLPKETRNGCRVLIADDDALSQLLTLRMLERRGYAVSVVGNGREAVTALERERFDVVLMDIVMPDMDGYETTKEIRALRKNPTGPWFHAAFVKATNSVLVAAIRWAFSRRYRRFL